ncbi:DUF6945 domain-containing protein [Pseudescherichia vulneris]|uniref:DUF6945 domain-containing protein n=1 Tax=Pseudescherichia vulneris TaxID=566 RepID=UPI001EE0D05A|nr:hypothetical protein [Pseudescherichia vulneris]
MNKSNNQNDYFFKFYKSFFFCTSVLNKLTGEEVKATSSMFEIYTYMLDQYLSYTSEGSTFYENQLDICKKLRGMNPKTFRSNYKKLQNLGLVNHTERSSSCGKFKSHEYTVTAPEQADKWLIFKYAFDYDQEKVEQMVVNEPLPQRELVPLPDPLLDIKSEPAKTKTSFAEQLDEVEFQDLAKLERVKNTVCINEPNLYPWGAAKPYKSNGDYADEPLQWALEKTGGDRDAAIKLIEKNVRPEKTVAVMIEDDDDSIPF